MLLKGEDAPCLFVGTGTAAGRDVLVVCFECLGFIMSVSVGE